MSPRERRPLLWALLSTLLALGACTGTEPTAVVPDLVGSYVGTWTYSVTEEEQPLPPMTCAATFSVSAQVGSRFYGWSQLSGAEAVVCSQIIGISDGSVSTNGALEFRTSTDPAVGVSSTGCYVASMPPFTGDFSGKTISASRVFRTSGRVEYSLRSRGCARRAA